MSAKLGIWTRGTSDGKHYNRFHEEYPTFDTTEEAQAWLTENQPDDGPGVVHVIDDVPADC
jgi:hypothetical protein